MRFERSRFERSRFERSRFLKAAFFKGRVLKVTDDPWTRTFIPRPCLLPADRLHSPAVPAPGGLPADGLRSSRPAEPGPVFPAGPVITLISRPAEVRLPVEVARARSGRGAAVRGM